MRGSSHEHYGKGAPEVPIPDTCCNCEHYVVCKFVPETPEKRELMAQEICKKYKHE